MISREKAFSLLEQNLRNSNLRKHSLAVAKIMEKLAEKLNQDKEKWFIVGLLHDLDYEETIDNPSLHGIKSAEMLKDFLDEESLHAIKSHNFENTKIEPKNLIDFALIASDAISGLIVATALVMPSKKLEEVKLESLKKKFKQKDFARKIDRNRILFCEKIGLNLEEFLDISLNALKEISKKLGL